MNPQETRLSRFVFPAETVSKYAYLYDAVGRRTSVVNSGSAFAATAFNGWGYNPRSGLTASNRYLGEDPLNRPPVRP